MAKAKGKTSDAVEILRRRFIEGDPEMAALVEQERFHADVAQQIYDLRARANLTQAQLAALVGTTASAICRLEDADYEGHSLSALWRIAVALGSHVEGPPCPRQEGSAAEEGRGAGPPRQKRGQAAASGAEGGNGHETTGHQASQRQDPRRQGNVRGPGHPQAASSRLTDC